MNRAAYIESLLTDWPAPTPQQQRTVMTLLYGEKAAHPTGPSAWQLEQQRKAEDREAALREARKSALALTACDVCNLQPEQHVYAQRGGIDSHEWTPGRAEKLLGNHNHEEGQQQ